MCLPNADGRIFDLIWFLLFEFKGYKCPYTSTSTSNCTITTHKHNKYNKNLCEPMYNSWMARHRRVYRNERPIYGHGISLVIIFFDRVKTFHGIQRIMTFHPITFIHSFIQNIDRCYTLFFIVFFFIFPLLLLLWFHTNIAKKINVFRSGKLLLRRTSKILAHQKLW